MNLWLPVAYFPVNKDIFKSFSWIFDNDFPNLAKLEIWFGFYFNYMINFFIYLLESLSEFLKFQQHTAFLHKEIREKYFIWKILTSWFGRDVYISLPWNFTALVVPYEIEWRGFIVDRYLACLCVYFNKLNCLKWYSDQKWFSIGNVKLFILSLDG